MAHEALAAYEAARHRLPAPKTGKAAPRTVRTLGDLAQDFDAFFLDAFGVLNVGETAIPGVPDRIRDLQAIGKRVLVVSNAAGFPHDRLLEKYAKLGYDFAPDDVVTSRKALAAAVGPGTGQRWGLMVSDGVPAAEFDALDHVRLREDPSAYAEADIFLMIGSATWTEARQALLEEALLAKPRPVYVGNPDIVAPREKGFSTEPGHFAHRLADRTGVTPEFFGKPFSNIYDIAFSRLAADIPKSDVLGAQTAGVASALVTDFGFLAGQDVGDAIAQTGIVPDVILPSP